MRELRLRRPAHEHCEVPVFHGARPSALELHLAGQQLACSVLLELLDVGRLAGKCGLGGRASIAPALQPPECLERGAFAAPERPGQIDRAALRQRHEHVAHAVAERHNRDPPHAYGQRSLRQLHRSAP